MPLAPVLLGIGGCAESVAPGPGFDDPPRRVFALGYLEPADGIIAITAAPGDRLKWLDPDVSLNGRTPENGVLGMMASYDTRREQLRALQTKRGLAAQKHLLDKAVADAQIKSAEASLAQAAAKRKEIQLQSKRLSYLREAADIAAADHRRLVELTQADEQLVSAHQVRRQKNRADQATKDFEIAEARFESSMEAAEAALAAAQANKTAAELSRQKLDTMNPVEAIDAEIRLGRRALAETVLLTPDQNRAEIDPTGIECVADAGDTPGAYTVLKVFLNPGEAVTQTPVMQLGDLNRIVCVAEVYEADAKNIRAGQAATITSGAFHEPYDGSGIRGEVESISRVVSNAGLQQRNPLAPVDRSVVRVRVAISPKDAEATAEAGRWIGLQVNVTFDE